MKACQYCASQEKTENHVWDADGLRCLRCGYSKVRRLEITNYDKLLIEVTVNGETRYSSGYGGNVWSSSITEGQTVAVKVTPKAAYEIAGNVSATGITITNEQVDAETGAHTFGFTMPRGDVRLGYNVQNRQFEAHLIYDRDMGSVRFGGLEEGAAVSCWANQQMNVRVQPWNEKYVVREVNVYRRNADGSNGDLLRGKITPFHTQPNHIYYYKVTVPTSSLNIKVTFGRAGRAEVYHVLQTFDGEGGAIWPVEAPEPLPREALGSYHADLFPSKAALEEGQSDVDFAVYGYSWSYATIDSLITPLGEGYNERTITIPEERDALYIYYKRENATLEVRDANYSNAVTYNTVPVGAPLLTYLQNQLHLAPGTAEDSYPLQWATKTAATSRSYALLTENTAMPAGTLAVYPVDPRQYAHVLLDVGACDRNARNIGDFWGAEWGDSYVAYNWPNHADPGNEPGRVYMDANVARSWRLQLGDALIVYDAGEGVWSDGGRYNTQVVPGNGGKAYLLSAVPTKCDGGWRFYRWELPAMGKNYSSGEPLDYSASSLLGGQSRLVSDEDIANTADPDARNIIRMTASYQRRQDATCTVHFSDGEGSDAFHKASLPIPAGEGKVRLSVTADGGVTRVIDATGRQVAAFNTPAREDCVFQGWRTESGEAQWGHDITAYRAAKGKGDAAVRLYACWEENPHRLALDLDGGSWPSDTYVRISYAYGETIPWDAFVPVKANHDFAGWRLEDGSEPPAQMPHGDVAARAQWKRRVYTMCFIVVGSEPYYIRGAMGERIDSRLPADPENRVDEESGDGYAFIGWYPSDPPRTMPGEDTTFIARWLITPKKPDAPELEALDITTVSVVDPDPGKAYSIDGGKTWLKPEWKEITEEVAAQGEAGESVLSRGQPGVQQRRYGHRLRRRCGRKRQSRAQHHRADGRV